jgi:hypothetical protein
MHDDTTSVYAFFHGEPGGPLDKAARGIFEAHNGRRIGAGQFIGGERDVEYAFTAEHAPTVAAALKKAGFRTKVVDKSAFRAMGGTQMPGPPSHFGPTPFDPRDPGVH